MLIEQINDDDDDPRDILARMSATSRACRARGIRRTTRHTDKMEALYTAAILQPTSQVKLAFYDTDNDILADILGKIVARMSLLVSASWNASLRAWQAERGSRASSATSW